MDDMPKDDFRLAGQPRFAKENFDKVRCLQTYLTTVRRSVELR